MRTRQITIQDVCAVRVEFQRVRGALREFTAAFKALRGV